MTNFRKLFSHLLNWSSITWGASVLGVVTTIAVATKLGTHDPDFSPGDPENIYLVPMLTFFFLGLLAFLTMAISGILKFTSKEKHSQYKSLLRISTKAAFVFTVFILFGALSFLFGMRQANIGQYAEEINVTVTGQEIFDAINKYRQSNGFTSITLDERLCDNLVQRYLDMTNPDNKYIGHAGFERWAQEQGLDTDYQLAEIYVSGIRSGAEAINFWVGSPGHKSALVGDYRLGCAYANQGIAVAVFGNNK